MVASQASVGRQSQLKLPEGCVFESRRVLFLHVKTFLGGYSAFESRWVLLEHPERYFYKFKKPFWIQYGCRLRVRVALCADISLFHFIFGCFGCLLAGRRAGYITVNTGGRPCWSFDICIF
jgi:hypothetical protein